MSRCGMAVVVAGEIGTRVYGSVADPWDRCDVVDKAVLVCDS